MNYVFVIDQNRNPLQPCHPAKARKLLSDGKAAVIRRHPFTIILKKSISQKKIKTQPIQLKLDPGSKTTGIALVQFERSDVPLLKPDQGRVIWAAELSHRGQRIKDALESRRSLRRGRRNRHTRYRQARFDHRTRPKGWLAPSIMSRVHNVMTWVKRIERWCPVSGVSQELVKFDTQQMTNPDIQGAEYQRGELAGYEVREYLLEKFNRKCAYCGATNVPFEIEHIVPKSRGGSNSVTNLTIACHKCNQKKGNKTAAEFGHPKVQALARMPLKDAAAVNAARWALFQGLKNIGFDVEYGSGGLTKFNRAKRGLEKAHWIDAACVGKSTPNPLVIKGITPLLIQAMGHGNRQVIQIDSYGFPRKDGNGNRVMVSREKYCQGFLTGDIVKAKTAKGESIGTVRIAAMTKTTRTGCCILNGKRKSFVLKNAVRVFGNDGYQYKFNLDNTK